jgi:hypothetical protein
MMPKLVLGLLIAFARSCRAGRRKPATRHDQLGDFRHAATVVADCRGNALYTTVGSVLSVSLLFRPALFHRATQPPLSTVAAASASRSLLLLFGTL